jgi:hypothetical protein
VISGFVPSAYADSPEILKVCSRLWNLGCSFSGDYFCIGILSNCRESLCEACVICPNFRPQAAIPMRDEVVCGLRHAPQDDEESGDLNMTESSSADAGNINPRWWISVFTICWWCLVFGGIRRPDVFGGIAEAFVYLATAAFIAAVWSRCKWEKFSNRFWWLSVLVVGLSQYGQVLEQTRKH